MHALAAPDTELQLGRDQLIAEIRLAIGRVRRRRTCFNWAAIS